MFWKKGVSYKMINVKLSSLGLEPVRGEERVLRVDLVRDISPSHRLLYGRALQLPGY